jgi:hypothetical protein
MSCVSKRTSSWLMAATGASRISHSVQVTTLAMRLVLDGGSHPSRLRRWRQTRRAVARVTIASASTGGSPRAQVCGHLVTAMSQLSGEDDLPVLLIQECNARCLEALIELETQWRGLRVGRSGLQDDRERVASEHRRFAAGEQPPRLRRMAGRERLVVRVEDKNA